MTSGIDSNPEDEYADDEYTDHDAEDREQPSTPADIPDDEPKKTCSNSARKSRTARTTGNSRHSSVSCRDAAMPVGPAAVHSAPAAAS